MLNDTQQPLPSCGHADNKVSIASVEKTHTGNTHSTGSEDEKQGKEHHSKLQEIDNRSESNLSNLGNENDTTGSDDYDELENSSDAISETEMINSSEE